MRILAFSSVLFAASAASSSIEASVFTRDFAAALARTFPRSTPAPLDCETCETVVSVAQTLAENATSVSELIALVQGACSIIELPIFQTLCDALIAGIADVGVAALQFLDKEIQTIAWDIPLNFCATIVGVCTIDCCETQTAPEQLRLAPGSDAASLSITWTTLNSTAAPMVQWGATGGPLSSSAPASMRGAPWGGWQGTIYSATMSSLAPGSAYSYRVGDDAGGWSAVANFSTLPANAGTPARPLVFANIGDMGWGPKSNDTIAALSALIDAGAIDFVVHQGDVSYADGAEQNWDVFGRKIEKISSRCPYIVVPGNHEQVWWGGADFRARWTLPAPVINGSVVPVDARGNRTFFAFSAGGVHFTMFDTESPLDVGDVPAEEVAWLQNDVDSARAAAPNGWIIAAAHRPLYCTNGNWNTSDKDCAVFAATLRTQVEPALLKAAVDFVFTAHMHGFERSQPVAHMKPTPGAPIHIVNGAGGNRESNDDPHGDAPWSVPGAHFADIGYGIVESVVSETTGASWLAYSFIRSADGKVLDFVNVTK